MGCPHDWQGTITYQAPFTTFGGRANRDTVPAPIRIFGSSTRDITRAVSHEHRMLAEEFQRVLRWVTEPYCSRAALCEERFDGHALAVAEPIRRPPHYSVFLSTV